MQRKALLRGWGSHVLPRLPRQQSWPIVPLSPGIPAASRASTSRRPAATSSSGTTAEPHEEAAPDAKKTPRKKASKAAESIRQGAATKGPEDDGSRAAVIDLSRGAPGEPSRWEGVKQWVVFSDLHVSGATVNASVAALRRVREEAEARSAGILFLGDFWHNRGSLPVEPLNAVLEEFSQWTPPTLMLVGNHDQVTAGGLSHSLTPLAAASPAVHVFDRPTEFLGALWLPYRRGTDELKEAVEAAGGRVGAIFAHVDVVGAYMNETFQARDGLLPELFPPHLPTYTGHYHRRHTVEGSNIHYIGSPFQVSRSEAGQEKALTLLDAAFQPQGHVPLDIGPRFFLVSPEGGSAGPDSAASARPAVREGDRVRVLLKGQAVDEEEAAMMKELRDEGARLEVVAAPPVAPARISAAEELDAVPLFHRYAEAASLGDNAVSTGLRILQDLEMSGARLSQPHLKVRLESLHIKGFGPFSEDTEYSLEGRGLQVVVGNNTDDQGADSNGAGKTALVMAPLWVLTGRVDGGRDGGGGRAATHSDVVSDSCKSASGRVEGEVNGVPFVVERRVTRRALSKLAFSLGGEDITQADSRMTQAKIDAELGTALLLRTTFFSQNAVSALLEATDKDFKAELGKMVDLDIWEVAKDHTALKLKEERAASERLSGQAEASEELCGTLRQQLGASRDEANGWEAQRALRLGELRRLCGDAEGGLAGLAGAARSLAAKLDLGDPPTASSSSSSSSSADRRGSYVAAEKAEKAARDALKAAEERGFALAETLKDLQGAFELRDAELRRAENTAARFRAAQDAADLTWREYGSLRGGEGNGRGGGGVMPPHEKGEPHGLEAAVAHDDASSCGAVVCDRCLQPVDSAAFERNLERLESELRGASEAAAAADLGASELSAATEALRAQARAAEEALGAARSGWKDASEELRRAETERLQMTIEIERAERERELKASAAREVSAQLRSAAGRAEHLVGGAAPGSREHQEEMVEGEEALGRGRLLVQRTEELSRVLGERRQRLAAEEAAESPYAMELRRLDSLLREAEASLSAQKKARSEAGGVIEGLEAAGKAFGRSGIPSFVLEGVLAELQAETSRFLKGMSSGFSLTLSPTKERSGGSGSRGRAAPVAEQITKVVHVRLPNGDIVERSLRQLSGGERRRVALALGLGFSHLSASRGRFDCNLLVLDEVLQHLDNDGCEAVASVLRSLPHGTILLVGQDNTFATEGFDAVDVVVKRDGSSTVEARVSRS